MVEGMQRKTLASQYQVKKVESSLKKALVIGFNLKASNSSKKSGSRMKHQEYFKDNEELDAEKTIMEEAKYYEGIDQRNLNGGDHHEDQ